MISDGPDDNLQRPTGLTKQIMSVHCRGLGSATNPILFRIGNIKKLAEMIGSSPKKKKKNPGRSAV